MSNADILSILRALKKRYPDAGCTLRWNTPLDLLVATILSAQCTDKRVNEVTKKLFQKYPSPQAYLAVSASELERDIHSCGTFRMKTRAIQESSQKILKEFGGFVPRRMDEMITLRGVGRKTASVVLGEAFGVHEGIAVDTHVMRVSQRLGLTSKKTQSSIEIDLMKKVPRDEWSEVSHLLIAHGRTVCTARGHTCHCRQELLALSS